MMCPNVHHHCRAGRNPPFLLLSALTARWLKIVDSSTHHKVQIYPLSSTSRLRCRTSCCYCTLGARPTTITATGSRGHRRAAISAPHPGHQPRPITSAGNPPAPPFPVFSRSSESHGGPPDHSYSHDSSSLLAGMTVTAMRRFPDQDPMTSENREGWYRSPASEAEPRVDLGLVHMTWDCRNVVSALEAGCLVQHPPVCGDPLTLSDLSDLAIGA